MTPLKRLATATLLTLGALTAWVALTDWGPTGIVAGWAFLAAAAHLAVRHGRRAKWAGLRVVAS